MADVASILQWGAIPAAAGLVDEAELSVKTLTRKAARDKKTYKNAKGAINGLRFINPMLTFSFVGVPATGTQFAAQHPGTGVASILNFSSSVHGFDPAQGVLVFEDPEDTLNQEDPLELKFDVVQYPFVTGVVTAIA